MLKVRIKTAGLPSQEVNLRPGTNRFGRASSNDFQIEHPSVSSTHCEIIFENDSIRIHDLGSTNGTYLNGKQIHEAVLRTGQCFQLGAVELVLETGSVSVPRSPSVCAKHPRIIASVECRKCEKTFCDLCITTRIVGAVVKKFCRVCHEECSLVNLDPAAHQTDDQRELALLSNALRYPIQRGGWVLLLGGSFLFFIIDIAVAGIGMGTPTSAAFALVFGVLAAGYLFAFLQQIITSTSLGEEKMPGWPDFTEIWQDMIQPFRLLWGLFACCFGPANICWYFAYNGSDLAEKLQTPLIVSGFLYLPMALTAVAMSDCLSSLNPVFILGSICKVPGQYLVACLLLALIIGLKWLAQVALARILPWFFVRYLISAAILLYFLIVEMRILGLMYLWNRRKLAWM